MSALRYVHIQAKKNSYFIIFFFIGLLLNLNLSYYEICDETPLNRSLPKPAKTSPAVTTQQKQSNGKKLVRPRYYSTELGIREKLFIGVLTSVDQIDHRAIAVNRTVAHLTDKIKFFISASQKYKAGHSLGNIVGFTDTRETLRPFHIIKYISDGFGQNYDYFFLMRDSCYLDGRLLRYIVNKISVSQDIYLGTRSNEGSYCLLDSGILLSNSVVKAIRDNLEWCVRNAFSDNHSDNIGRCIAHSIGLECQDEIQAQTLPSYRLKHYKVKERLNELLTIPAFNNAAVIQPISSPEDMYTLHALRSRQGIERIQTEVEQLENLVTNLTPELPEEYKEQPWPIGHRPGNKPRTRWDVPRHSYFNLTHKFFPDDYINVRKMTRNEKSDIDNILEAVITEARKTNGDKLNFRRLVNGYILFDLSRGLDYVMDIGFRNGNTGKEEIHRYEISKPLGKTELLPMPYVTENTRVTIVVLVYPSDLTMARSFLGQWIRTLQQQKTLIMLVLVYGAKDTSKGDGDAFATVKNMAISITNRSKRPDGTRAAWVSVRLPESGEINYDLMNIAAVDLALRKVGTDALVFLTDVYTEINVDCLNRVRMNTISNSQIFSPIPFRRYHPSFVQGSPTSMHINKNSGRFDGGFYNYGSFYGKDWVTARLTGENNLPIVRADRDLLRLFEVNEEWDVFKLFMRFAPNLSCIRAPEPGLTVKYRVNAKSPWLGSKTQLANLILSYAPTKF